MSTKETMIKLGADCVAELLESYGLRGVPASKEDLKTPFAHLAVVSYNHDDINGSLVLAASNHQITSNLGSHQPSEFLGEFANQAVGRLKNALLDYSVKVMIGVPTTIAGQFSELSIRAEHDAELRIVRLGDCMLASWLDVAFSDGFELKKSTHKKVGADEGAVLLF